MPSRFKRVLLQCRVEKIDCAILCSVHTGSGTSPSFLFSGFFSPGVKRSGLEADHFNIMPRFAIEQSMKAQSGSSAITYSFFNVGARGGWVVNATPRPLYTRARDRYPLYRRLGGLQGRSGRVLNISPVTGILSTVRPACRESLYRPLIMSVFSPYPIMVHIGTVLFWFICRVC